MWESKSNIYVYVCYLLAPPQRLTKNERNCCHTHACISRTLALFYIHMYLCIQVHVWHVTASQIPYCILCAMYVHVSALAGVYARNCNCVYILVLYAQSWHVHVWLTVVFTVLGTRPWTEEECTEFEQGLRSEYARTITSYHSQHTKTNVTVNIRSYILHLFTCTRISRCIAIITCRYICLLVYPVLSSFCVPVFPPVLLWCGVSCTILTLGTSPTGNNTALYFGSKSVSVTNLRLTLFTYAILHESVPPSVRQLYVSPCIHTYIYIRALKSLYLHAMHTNFIFITDVDSFMYPSVLPTWVYFLLDAHSESHSTFLCATAHLQCVYIPLIRIGVSCVCKLVTHILFSF